ncbi:carboxypeptidase-like regulatory domain-containing protein [Winogradskyella sp.]|uniref:carboxypeptidase-like regulatory domain-containing protein n=1 Tax=Winogradskyella sp. TaxID=1883156 RepID=UPI00260EFE91|nr:carboxypeptidase-like regulatory domain-containing protein [Winogradskyella sp.]
MKTQEFTAKSIYKTFGFIAILMIALFTFNTSLGQTNEKTITGLIVNEDGPLPGVNITLKGERVGTSTDFNGEFTFPKKLKTGDVLIFSYLGYLTQRVTINSENSFIKLELELDMVEMMGDLDTNTPYKTKRKKN